MHEKHETPETADLSDSGLDAAADLRALREARGLSLRDVFSATRVSLVNLQALEDGAFDRLPPPVYARNFIGKYARAVGIDATPLLARYERYLEKMTPPRAEEEVRRPWPENGRRWRFLVLSLAAVILAGSLVYAVFLYDQASPPPAPVAEPAVSAPADEPPPAEKGLPAGDGPPSAAAPTAPPPSAAQPPAAAGGSYHLLLTARELTWLRITQDRSPPYEVLLRPGDRIERTAAEFFLLDIGNAGGLHLTFQGQDLGVLGKSGQIRHLRLPEKTGEAGKAP